MSEAARLDGTAPSGVPVTGTAHAASTLTSHGAPGGTDASKRAKHAAEQRAWYQRNKGKSAAYQKAYLSENRSKIAVRRETYRVKNGKKISAYQAKYRAENKERLRAQNAAYYQAHRMEALAQGRAWRQNHKREQKAHELKHKYKITYEDWTKMLIEQAGRCAIDGEPFGPSVGEGEAVDHDHETGKVRELVHRRCNGAIGLFDDSPEKLEAAAAYLRRHRRAL